MKCDHKLDFQINSQYEKIALCMNEIKFVNEIHHTCD
jgi:hypothetical protein